MSVVTEAKLGTSIALAIALLGVTGCSPVVATYPKCPVPVLISRVNRVHATGHVKTYSAGTEQVLAGSSEQFAQASSSTTRSGNVQTTTTTSEHRLSGPPQLTNEVLQLVPNYVDATDADIELEQIWTGNYAMFILTYAMNEEWADPKGRKVYAK
jgi:hypothetical protein